MKQPDFDVAAAHRYFGPYCFNACWDLIEKSNRTVDDDRMMVALSQASLFHWRNRPDVTDKNLAIGYWQVSRVYALVGAAQEAKRYAELGLSLSGEAAPFHKAYAHEAMARAARGLGDVSLAASHLAQAWALVAAVKTEDDRKLLTTDLEGLGPRPA